MDSIPVMKLLVARSNKVEMGNIPGLIRVYYVSKKIDLKIFLYKYGCSGKRRILRD